MSNEVRHTPTPWKIRMPMPQGKTFLMREPKDNSWDGENAAEVFDNSHGTALGNAAFIVCAVNSHEALLKALKACVKEDCGMMATAEAIKVIAQAEGK